MDDPAIALERVQVVAIASQANVAVRAHRDQCRVLNNVASWEESLSVTAALLGTHAGVRPQWDSPRVSQNPGLWVIALFILPGNSVLR